MDPAGRDKLFGAGCLVFVKFCSIHILLYAFAYFELVSGFLVNKMAYSYKDEKREYRK